MNSSLAASVPPPDDADGQLATVLALGRELRNWGRWGESDELGTLNFITDAARRDARECIRTGQVLSLAIPLDGDGPMVGAASAQAARINPVRLMLQTGNESTSRFELGGGARYVDDFVTMPLQCSTHWDSLAHVFYDDRLFNGFPGSSVDSGGVHRVGIDKMHDRFATRGVLLDIPRAKGVQALGAGYAITVADLDLAVQHHGITLRPGDVVLVRTGLMASRRATGLWDEFQLAQPGLHYETTRWLHEKQVAAVACDNSRVEASDVVPGCRVPFHMIALRDMGLPLGEFWYLEDLAAACAADRVYDFFLVAQPLRFTGGAGSPLNPLAIR